jgi:hypothetical protein
MSAAGESSSPRYPPQGEAERAALIRYARETPLVYGAWRHLKRLYKDAEGGEEPEILGTLIGRLDAAPLAAAPPPFTPGGDFQAIPHGSAVLRERIAYLAANSRLHVIDLSDPGQPRQLRLPRDRRLRPDRAATGGDDDNGRHRRHGSR